MEKLHSLFNFQQTYSVLYHNSRSNMWNTFLIIELCYYKMVITVALKENNCCLAVSGSFSFYGFLVCLFFIWHISHTTHFKKIESFRCCCWFFLKKIDSFIVYERYILDITPGQNNVKLCWEMSLIYSLSDLNFLVVIVIW